MLKRGLVNYIATALLCIAGFAASISVSTDTILAGSVAGTEDVDVNSGAYLAMIHGATQNFGGNVNVDGALYIGNADSSDGKLTTDFTGGSLVNTGHIVVDNRNSSAALSMTWGGTTIENSGEIYFNGANVNNNGFTLQPSTTLNNKGLIYFGQDESSGYSSAVNIKGKTITNDGTICLKNVKAYLDASIGGSGCITIGDNTVYAIQSTNMGTLGPQTLYMSSSSSIIYVDTKGKTDNIKVAGFGNGNFLSFGTSIVSHSYDTKTGVLSFSIFIFISHKFNIGTGYTNSLFKQKQISNHIGLDLANNALYYNAPPPDASLPSACMPCDKSPWIPPAYTQLPETTTTVAAGVDSTATELLSFYPTTDRYGSVATLTSVTTIPFTIPSEYSTTATDEAGSSATEVVSYFTKTGADKGLETGTTTITIPFTVPSAYTTTAANGDDSSVTEIVSYFTKIGSAGDLETGTTTTTVPFTIPSAYTTTAANGNDSSATEIISYFTKTGSAGDLETGTTTTTVPFTLPSAYTTTAANGTSRSVTEIISYFTKTGSAGDLETGTTTTTVPFTLPSAYTITAANGTSRSVTEIISYFTKTGSAGDLETGTTTTTVPFTLPSAYTITGLDAMERSRTEFVSFFTKTGSAGDLETGTTTLVIIASSSVTPSSVASSESTSSELASVSSTASYATTVASSVSIAPSSSAVPWTTLFFYDPRVQAVELSVYANDIAHHQSEYDSYNELRTSMRYPQAVASAASDIAATRSEPNWSNIVTMVDTVSVCGLISGVPWYSTRLQQSLDAAFRARHIVVVYPSNVASRPVSSTASPLTSSVASSRKTTSRTSLVSSVTSTANWPSTVSGKSSSLFSGSELRISSLPLEGSSKSLKHRATTASLDSTLHSSASSYFSSKIKSSKVLSSSRQTVSSSENLTTFHESSNVYQVPVSTSTIPLLISRSTSNSITSDMSRSLSSVELNSIASSTAILTTERKAEGKSSTQSTMNVKSVSTVSTFSSKASETSTRKPRGQWNSSISTATAHFKTTTTLTSIHNEDTQTRFLTKTSRLRSGEVPGAHFSKTRSTKYGYDEGRHVTATSSVLVGSLHTSIAVGVSNSDRSTRTLQNTLDVTHTNTHLYHVSTTESPVELPSSRVKSSTGIRPRTTTLPLVSVITSPSPPLIIETQSNIASNFQKRPDVFSLTMSTLILLLVLF
ncbi:uncharacterized protein KNAG_0I02620 [Huiozyma naganishii CBS 8797]|uniref:Hyphally-regulated cell wall protein N-terminal domain-containing protein n=1 Tax=Huiozyma naganishii (strain ATCC MYA-139 / BCRC 22969 / CBS 8797 / KCTC 17520 / NBRC 10181 / NCYC 3082 / Yp74L-3) TaxID=1071383 RepID=J7S2I9_HUIN7|nr:hypothetical protein KNAG_0I02620 [Kazachstania naganishii CBS 8797]CCK72047.1 hypothetical protein KNAG_0I02620 [Kazachstania naganishii CBS 8797]